MHFAWIRFKALFGSEGLFESNYCNQLRTFSQGFLTSKHYGVPWLQAVAIPVLCTQHTSAHFCLNIPRQCDVSAHGGPNEELAEEWLANKIRCVIDPSAAVDGPVQACLAMSFLTVCRFKRCHI